LATSSTGTGSHGETGVNGAGVARADLIGSLKNPETARMQDLVLLNPAEEQALLQAIQASAEIQRLRQFFLWAQGPLRALLAHEVLVCLRLNEQGRVTHAEYLHSVAHAPEVLARLVDPVDGLGLRIARHCTAAGGSPCLFPPPDESPDALAQDGTADAPHDAAGAAWAALGDEVRQLGLRNVLAHGTGLLAGGGTFFSLFGLTHGPNSRDAFALSLLLPQLHIAFLRVLASRNATVPALPPGVALSERELEVLNWVVLGKSNPEIGMILSLSSLTIKNHLQRIYRKLNVHNRVQAIARCRELKLLINTEP